MQNTAGVHRSGAEYLQGLAERKRLLCSREPPWERRGPRDREIAALNRQIDHLLDQWRIKHTSTSSPTPT